MSVTPSLLRGGPATIEYRILRHRCAKAALEHQMGGPSRLLVPPNPIIVVEARPAHDLAHKNGADRDDKAGCDLLSIQDKSPHG